MAPPEGFVDLATSYNATKETFVSIIGVVIDLMPSALTRTNEHMLTFKLLDERLRDSVHGDKGLQVRFFKKDIQSLPRISQIGDVVLLRNIKMTTFSYQPIALSNYQSSSLVFPAALIPDPSFQISFVDKRRIECLGVPQDKERLSLAEQKYVIHLKQEMSSLIESLPPMRMNMPTIQPAVNKRPGETLAPAEIKKQRRSTWGLKFKLVEELRQEKDWADICVQVVKKFANQFGTCELYVTDYTENKAMFYHNPPEIETERERDGDQFGYSGPPKREWPGPYGYLVLKVNVKEPHAYFVNTEVHEGDFVLLQNVKTREMAAEGARLEGDMWADHQNPERVKVVKLKRDDFDAPELKTLLGRKERYWAARGAKAAAKGQVDDKKKLTKPQRKKQRQAERKAATAAPSCDGVQNVEATVTRQSAATNGQRKTDLNPHIRCGHEEVPISPIKVILDPENKHHTNTTREGQTYILPFVNAKFRARVRVVEFAPKQLEDFSFVEDDCNDNNSEEFPMIIDYDSSPRNEWSFALLLEDANSKMKNAADETANNRLWVNLGHQEAQYLFGNNVNDPTDLRSDHGLLVKLREKLCILWGNLEEKAEEDGISNRPFECCLMEYGVEMDDDDPEKAETAFGFKRLYRMFGVTIL